MDTLHTLAELSAIFLSLLLFLATILFAAICIGIWYGLRRAGEAASPWVVKANDYLEKGRELEHTYLGFAVRPFIAAHMFGTVIGVTLSSLIDQAKQGAAKP